MTDSKAGSLLFWFFHRPWCSKNQKMNSCVGLCSNWAELPDDLLDMVMEKLVLFSDYARFSSVCVSWHYVANFNRKKFAKKLDREFPLFLFPKKGDEKGEMKSLYNAATKKLMKTEVRVPFSTRYGGSSRGWLINPISLGSVIKLPPITKNAAKYFVQIRKALLSADPTTEPHDYEVAAIYGQCGRLAVIKPDVEEDWTYIDHIQTVFDDVIYYEGRLHAGDYSGKVFCFNDKLSSSFRGPSPMHNAADEGKTYLVESLKGNFLLVYRYFEIFSDTPLFRATWSFKVSKWNHSQAIWVEVKSLGVESLFLGDNMSTSMLAFDFLGCSSNSIYFTHDFDYILYTVGDRGPIDSGVFNLEDSYIFPHHVTEHPLSGLCRISPLH